MKIRILLSLLALNLSIGTGAYASFGVLSASASVSSSAGQIGWNIGVGIGIGNDAIGASATISYGADGFAWGLGGYYNSHAWDDNPTYNPDFWNDNGYVQNNNNCYSYALDDPYNPIGERPQPGDYSGSPFTKFSAEDIINAAIRDGKIRKLTFLNKLGFGKKGYYSICLVLDTEGALKDYHWYRQDKGGFWSQKHGLSLVTNVDGSNHLIINPSFANHYYGWYINYSDSLNYNSKVYYLWARKVP